MAGHPQDHYPDVAALAAATDGPLDEVITQAHQVATAEEIAERGYRIVFNTGADAARPSTMCTRICWADAPGLAPGFARGRRISHARPSPDTMSPARSGAVRRSSERRVTGVRNDDLRARRDSDGDGNELPPSGYPSG